MGAGVGYVVSTLPGGQTAGQEVTDQTGTVDGYVSGSDLPTSLAKLVHVVYSNGTEGSAKLGEAVGQAELDIGNGVTETAFGTTSGNGGPSKRQLDKMGAGVGYVVSAAPGGQTAGQEITDQTSTIDGNATNGSAMLGEAVGDFELNVSAN